MQITFKNNPKSFFQQIGLQKIPQNKRLANIEDRYEKRKEGMKKATLIGVFTGLIGLAIAYKKNSAHKVLLSIEGFAAGFIIADILSMFSNRIPKE